ncbi:hypothetical protein EFK50_06835 [Nocardioides marmoriginsengisoli]|uniref:Peptidase MA-like domain-containing protein n=1 Tax=Nocardioides marmoriginsengisoli TaxID=661483 RepID=A0A3N0CLS4_9ACTN|nr:hypothetical protein [Nocardioides marmoriginsengisoli]RNL64241.1 hypothetical protein EFK50_06835 [Nocardioides marmoriginsengisoli]
MPSAPADLRALPGALLLALLLGVGGCSDDTSITPPTASSDSSTSRSAAAAVTVAALEKALRSGDAGAAAATGLGPAGPMLEAAAANVGALHLVDLGLRFVDERSDVADVSETGAWRGTVEVRYRLRDWDQGTTTVETTFTFAPGEHGQVITGIGGTSGRTPLWLTGPVKAVASGRTLVVAQGGSQAGATRYSALARKAVVAVGKVLPRWKGTLVIEAPSDEEGLDRALGASQDEYANIAAVTASVDGSLDPGSPVHVFLNPRVFDALGPRGAQVVVSHESTHVATEATFVSMPTWLLEGFADYVALAHAGIPVRTAASQILARIRKDGPPDHLPTADDLAPTAAGLGATYEEAWLATRFIAQSYGEKKLVAFYDAVDGGTSAEQAFRQVLGTTQAAFVKRWSADSRNLARAGVSGSVGG